MRRVEGLPVGRMVPAQPQAPGAPAAACKRCGCRLSRYRDHWEEHCAACRTVLVAEGALRVPTFEPVETTSADQARRAVTAAKPRKRRLTAAEKAENWRYDACACGRGLKRTDRKRCRECYNDARRVPGARWSATCACGGKKSKGAEMCMRCRYGIIAA